MQKTLHFLSLFLDGAVDLLESRVDDEIGTKYYCEFITTGSDRSLPASSVQWTVNGNDVRGYSQFEISHSSNAPGHISSGFFINSPVALYGETEIKCTVKGVSGSFLMDSEFGIEYFELKRSN